MKAIGFFRKPKNRVAQPATTRTFTRHPVLYGPRRDVEILEWRARSFTNDNNGPKPLGKDFENDNSTC